VESHHDALPTGAVSRASSMRAQVVTPPRGQRPPDATNSAGSAVVTVMPAPPRPPLGLDVRIIDFGQCPYGSRRKVETISGRTVNIMNNSDVSIPCVWGVPAGPFEVSPLTSMLEPHSNTAFSVGPYI
jgi:hypothetical protein